MSPSIFMILTNFMLDLDTWTPWDAVQTTPGMSIGPPFITGKKISSGIFRFWQPWLLTSGSAAKKQENNERTGKSEKEILTDADMGTFSPPPGDLTACCSAKAACKAGNMAATNTLNLECGAEDAGRSVLERPRGEEGPSGPRASAKWL